MQAMAEKNNTPSPATEPPDDAAASWRSRLGWYGALLLGVLPFLVLGFVLSALANALVFVAWGLVLTACHVGVLRWVWRAGCRRSLLAAALCGVAAVGWGTLGALVARHGEILDLALRALLPALYHPRLAQPGPEVGVAGLFAVTAVALAVASRFMKRHQGAL